MARHRSRRHRASASVRKGRRHASRLRSTWRRATRRGGKYSHLAAVVRTHKNGTVRKGRRKHVRHHAWSGRKGTVALFSRKTGKLWGTNPRRRHGRHRARGRRFNPMGGFLSTAKSYLVEPVTDLPKGIPALFKGHLVKHAGFALGGTIVAMVGGNILQKYTLPLIAKLPGASGAMSGGIVQRVLGASYAILAGSIIGKLGLKDQDSRNAFVTGAAAAALVEAVFPGRLGALLAKLPVIGGWIGPAASPVQGIAGLFGTDDLAAYVQAPGYQGVGAYVQAPGYQGVGAYVQAPGYQGVGAYVQAPGYEGSIAGGQEAVAGLGYAGEQLAGNLDGIGSNMMSHLDA
jgi:hypothetical protein